MGEKVFECGQRTKQTDSVDLLFVERIRQRGVYTISVHVVKGYNKSGGGLMMS